MKGKIHSFKELDVWMNGIEITNIIYQEAEKFPKQAVWGLGTQMQCSALSIPSNIAEGSERKHTPEYIQFCYIALGACAELETQIIISEKRGYLSKNRFKQVLNMIVIERKMLKGLIRELNKRKNYKKPELQRTVSK